MIKTDYEIQVIQKKIVTIPGRPPAMLDRDLAELYGTTTKRVNQAVKRNPDRFPEDFCFQLAKEDVGRSQSVTFTHAPFAFTREGANMLSAVLHTDTAIERSVQIMRAFSAIEQHNQCKPQVFDPSRILNDPSAMRGLLLTYTEKVLALEEAEAENKPKVEIYNRIANADGSTNITVAAKTLQVRPKDLFENMSRNKWIYRRAGGKGWIAYQDRIQQGHLIHKVTTVSTSDGREKTVEQVLVTPRGLIKLAGIVRTAS